MKGLKRMVAVFFGGSYALVLMPVTDMSVMCRRNIRYNRYRK